MIDLSQKLTVIGQLRAYLQTWSILTEDRQEAKVCQDELFEWHPSDSFLLLTRVLPNAKRISLSLAIGPRHILEASE